MYTHVYIIQAMQVQIVLWPYRRKISFPVNRSDYNSSGKCQQSFKFEKDYISTTVPVCQYVQLDHYMMNRGAAIDFVCVLSQDIADFPFEFKFTGFRFGVSKENNLW